MTFCNYQPELKISNSLKTEIQTMKSPFGPGARSQIERNRSEHPLNLGSIAAKLIE